MKKDTATLQWVYTVLIPTFFPPKELQPFTWLTRDKGTPTDLVNYHRSPVREGGYKRPINEILDKCWLTVSPLSPQARLVVISIVPEYINGIDVLGSWSNPCIGSVG